MNPTAWLLSWDKLYSLFMIGDLGFQVRCFYLIIRLFWFRTSGSVGSIAVECVLYRHLCYWAFTAYYS